MRRVGTLVSSGSQVYIVLECGSTSQTCFTAPVAVFCQAFVRTVGRRSSVETNLDRHQRRSIRHQRRLIRMENRDVRNQVKAGAKLDACLGSTATRKGTLPQRERMRPIVIGFARAGYLAKCAPLIGRPGILYQDPEKRCAGIPRRTAPLWCPYPLGYRNECALAVRAAVTVPGPSIAANASTPSIRVCILPTK